MLLNDLPIEITTFRKDGDYKDHRRPDFVEFVSDLKTDLTRRDFTVNALAYNDEEGLLDFVGGLLDLRNRLLRTVGAPKERFTEDALRIFRAVRFSAVLCFSIEEETKEAIHALKETLLKISQERLQKELCLLLVAKDPGRAMREYSDVLGVILPEIIPSFDFDQRNPYHSSDVWEHTVRSVEDIEPDLVLRLVMLFHDIGKPKCFTLDEKGIGHFYNHQGISAELAKSALLRLRFDNATISRVEKLIFYHDMDIYPNPKSVKKALSILGKEDFEAILRIKRADTIAKSDKCRADLLELSEIRNVYHKVLENHEAYTLKDLKIDGRDLLALGVPAGKEIGGILEELLLFVLSDEVSNTEESLQKKAKELISERNFKG